jgi:hypothetical protein
MTAAARTSYERTTRGYDDDHERELLDAIMTAIAEASRVSDCNAMVIRTGEAASALLSALAFTLTMSPAATRSPTALRKTMDELGKRLRRRVAHATADPELQAFLARVFRSRDVQGNA